MPTIASSSEPEEPVDRETVAQLRASMAAFLKLTSPKFDFPQLEAFNAAIAAATPNIYFRQLDAFNAAIAVATPKVDPFQLARVRAAIAAATPKIQLTQLPSLRIALDAAMPKIDIARLNAYVKPNYDTLDPAIKSINAAFESPIRRDLAGVHRALAAAAPSVDFTELIGLRSVAATLASTIDLKQVADLAKTAEALLAQAHLRNFEDEIDPKLVEWAASFEVNEDDLDQTAASGPDGDLADGVAVQLRLRLLAVARLLLATAVQLQGGAAKLRSAGANLNEAVDSFNVQAERYERLGLTLIKLYGALIILTHVRAIGR